MVKLHNFNHTKQTAGSKWVIGIDEAGRGPLAGPVVVAGVRIEARSTKHELRMLKNIRDSKKLTPKQREEWFRVITDHPHIEWAAAKISPKVIDRINIARATNLGAFRVLRKLERTKLSPDRSGLSLVRVLLDGSLYLPRRIPHETIIKGDEKIPAIAAASIIAKVIRDRMMARLHRKFPQYGFERHKGYGTILHRRCIYQYGLLSVHRHSFCRKIVRQ